MESSNLPNHIVIVPDGNRRWAKARSLPSFAGHERGAASAEKVFDHALKLGINNLTFWGSSYDNLTKRSSDEVGFLLKIFGNYFASMLKDVDGILEKNRIRVRVLGRWREQFPSELQRIVGDIIRKTEKNDARNFTLLMAYSGVDDMTEAVSAIAERARKEPGLAVTPETVKQSLWTRDLPPVDLVIRTGGEPHWSSGLLMWDVADAELYFTETLWPDFSPEEFDKAIAYYTGRERRRGK
jgi:undecaprenyl diphosphate synthase